MSEYTLESGKLKSLKAAVTRARNKKDWEAVKLACAKAFQVFEVEGYPDCWADFRRWSDDATFQLSRRGIIR